MFWERITKYLKLLAKALLLAVNLFIYTFVVFALYESTITTKKKKEQSGSKYQQKYLKYTENVACRGGSSGNKKCYRPILKIQYLFNGNNCNSKINLATQYYKSLADNIAKTYYSGQDFQIFRNDNLNNLNKILTAEQYYNKYYRSSKNGLVNLLAVFIIFVPTLIATFFFCKYSDKEAA